MLQVAVLVLHESRYHIILLFQTQRPIKHFLSHLPGQHSSPEKDYYKILGVPKDASQEEIKKAFHSVSVTLQFSLSPQGLLSFFFFFWHGHEHAIKLI